MPFSSSLPVTPCTQLHRRGDESISLLAAERCWSLQVKRHSSCRTALNCHIRHRKYGRNERNASQNPNSNRFGSGGRRRGFLNWFLRKGLRRLRNGEVIPPVLRQPARVGTNRRESSRTASKPRRSGELLFAALLSKRPSNSSDYSGALRQKLDVNTVTSTLKYSANR